MALSRREFVKIAGIGGTSAALGVVAPSIAGAQPGHQSGHQPGNGRRLGQLACDFSLGIGAEKPVPMLTAGMDAAAQSRVDTLFWSVQMMEHALFFASMLPGNELADWRARALDFADRWSDLLAQIQGATFTASSYQGFNNETLSLLAQYIPFKQQLETAQDTAQIFSLVFPSFARHTRNGGGMAPDAAPAAQ